MTASTDPKVIGEADAVIVCVPTPLNKTKEPDISYIVSATEEIAQHQHAGMLIVLESTTYPGTTREVMAPRLTQNGKLALGKDVFLCFSPERVDPGNQKYGTRNTPKVLGGSTPECLETGKSLYTKIIDTVVPVSSTDAAEMVKLLENTFRAVNIGLVNEIALISRRLGIDAFEVIRAAATKPFGFMPFYPGPGLGGHCIPIDPLYLSWKLRELKFQAKFIELADTVNSAMPEYVVQRVADALNDEGKAVKGAKVLISGIAYKKNITDMRESPAFDVLAGLEKRGAHVTYADPWVPEVEEHGMTLKSVDPKASFAGYDAVVIITDHDNVDYARMVNEASLVVDTRDVLRKHPAGKAKIIGLLVRTFSHRAAPTALVDPAPRPQGRGLAAPRGRFRVDAPSRRPADRAEPCGLRRPDVVGGARLPRRPVVHARAAVVSMDAFAAADR
jgi:UDP-N-acetyl-D-glucosamine dehydrogenase